MCLCVFVWCLCGVCVCWCVLVCVGGVGVATRPGRRGSHTTARELQTCTFERPGASNTTKIPREDPQRGKKRTNFAAGQGKKSAKFGPPPLRGPTLRGPPFPGSGPHPSGSHPSHPSGPKRVLFFHVLFCLFEKQDNTETLKLAKIGLAKVGHPNFGQNQSIKVGQSRFGQNRSQPLQKKSNVHS